MYKILIEILDVLINNEDSDWNQYPKQKRKVDVKKNYIWNLLDNIFYQLDQRQVGENVQFVCKLFSSHHYSLNSILVVEVFLHNH